MDGKLRRRAWNNPILGSVNPNNDAVPDIYVYDVRRRSLLLSEKIWFIVLFFYVGIFAIVLYCDAIRLPSPADYDDREKFRSSKFSEVKARTFVNALSNFGPKVSGSYVNEVLVVDYLKKQLTAIEKTCKPHNKLEVNVQTTSGCFPLDFKDGMTSCYRNVKNVIAKIGPKASTNRSLLVNCHYDSVPTSPGASDDAVSCSIMLEVLFALSQHSEPLKHSVVFLFNGAEENILQASHGFISQHPWAKEIIGFINLEACGAGGKQMLFQSDERRTWLLEAYAESASYPQGSVLAQDIFQSGLIPSDTDYRIFKDFGGLPGLDFAFVKNGYVYHTKYDTPNFISPGEIQQAGDNLLQLIYKALKSPVMDGKSSKTDANLAYFDFLGLFMVIYHMQFSSAISVFIIILSCIDTYMKIRLNTSGEVPKERMITLGKAVAVMVAGFIISVMINCLIAIFLDFFGLTMMWYSSPALIISLYGCPALGIIIFLHHFFRKIDAKGTAAGWAAEDAYFDAARMIWIFLLMIMEYFRLKSSFICSAWIVFPTMIRSFSSWILYYRCTKDTMKCLLFLVIHFAMQIVPLLLLLYCMWSMYTVFIPILGFSGAIVNPDLLIGAFTAFVVFLATSYTLSIVQIMDSSHKAMLILGIAVLGTFSLAIFTPFAFPYSANPDSPALQRYYLLHTKRTMHNKTEISAIQDSGYWIVPLDYNGPATLEPYIKGLKGREPVNCKDELICGMPFYMPLVSLLKKSFYVPSSEPKIYNHSEFRLLSQVRVKPNLYNFTFSAVGPDHMTVVFSPRTGVNLLSWSLTDGDPFPSLKWQKRQTYFIYYSYGEYTEPWEFSLILKIPEKFKQGQPVLDLVFVSHYLYGPSAVADEFQSLLNQIPEWVHVTPWSTSLEIFAF